LTGGGVVTGYLLDDISTAVLSIPSFYQYGRNIQEFESTVMYFLGNATQKNASRIVIDLQTNAGGSVLLAYAIFKRFFYRIEPYAASRIRSHHLANFLGNAYSSWWKELENDLGGGQDGLNGDLYNFTAAEERVAVNRINAATGEIFSLWADYYGRVSDHGDLFSAAVSNNKFLP
jgi:hypothetical protein